MVHYLFCPVLGTVGRVTFGFYAVFWGLDVSGSGEFCRRGEERRVYLEASWAIIRECSDRVTE